MERKTVRFREETLEDIERLVERDEYPNASEAIRQYVRDGLADENIRPQPWTEYDSDDDDDD